MHDTMFKLGLLVSFLRNSYAEWKREVWNRELDAPYCCPGTMRDECGCRGTTVRELYEYDYSKSKDGGSK